MGISQPFDDSQLTGWGTDNPNGSGTYLGNVAPKIQTTQNTLGEGLSAIDQQPYVNAANAAMGQAANYYGEGQRAAGVAAPTIDNRSAAASRQQLQGVQTGYQQSDSGLAATMGGGGPNAGAATEQQGLNSNIAAQMAAAHSGTGGQGGYSQAGAAAGQNAGAAANSALASQAAQARGAQIGQAQSQAGQNYAAQGGLALQQGNIQEQAALQQAQMAQRQQGMDTQQAQALYGQSVNEQGLGLSATNQYLAQQEAAQQMAIQAQNQGTGQLSDIVNDASTGVKAAATIGVLAA